MNFILLLDNNYVALSIISWKKAIKLILNDKAVPISDKNSLEILYNFGKSKFIIPSVIKLINCVPWKAHENIVKFSRKNVLSRDKYRCAYCNVSVSKNASIDHIVPKSKGGKTSYYNCVTCCPKCNGIKSNLTLEDAGMTLKIQPKKPSFLSLHKTYIEKIPENWNEFLTGRI